MSRMMLIVTKRDTSPARRGRARRLLSIILLFMLLGFGVFPAAAQGQPGAFIDAFVSAGSGGLEGPDGLVFGRDGNLYVSSSFSNVVLRYDGRQRHPTIQA